MSRNSSSRTKQSETASNDAVAASSFLEQAEALGLKTEEDFATKFPLTYAAFKAWGRDEKPALRVTSKVAGFRRSGLVHSAAPVLHDVMTLTFEQMEQLLAEPVLICELVEAPAETVESEDADAGAVDVKG